MGLSSLSHPFFLPSVPVVAILCGVAVGLTSVAVGVILVVKNRSGPAADEAHEGGGGGSGSGGGDSGSGGGGGDGRGKYDAISTKENVVDGGGHCVASRDRQMMMMARGGE